MDNPKTLEEQFADMKRFNEALRTQIKKVNEELTATRNNQRTLIDLLADTMRRLREAEAALEEEKKKPLLRRAVAYDPWRTNVWEAGARACEVLLAGTRPLEAQACDGSKEPVTVPPTTTQAPLSEEDLYA